MKEEREKDTDDAGWAANGTEGARRREALIKGPLHGDEVAASVKWEWGGAAGGIGAGSRRANGHV